MKVFCFSFIVYFVLLITQPCEDILAYVDSCNGKNTEIVHLDNTSDSDPQADDCSPFCICSCCSLSAADRSVARYISASIESVSIEIEAIEYLNPYSKAHQNSIWQPPKV